MSGRFLIVSGQAGIDWSSKTVFLQEMQWRHVPFFCNIRGECIEETHAHHLCPRHHFGKKATAKLKHQRHMDACCHETLDQLAILFTSGKISCGFDGCQLNHEELKAELIHQHEDDLGIQLFALNCEQDHEPETPNMHNVTNVFCPIKPALERAHS